MNHTTGVTAAGTKVVEYSKVDAGLQELRGRMKGVVYDVSTPTGMIAARKDRRECVVLRTNLESIRKTLKADVLERGRLIDGEAAKIRESIEEIEAPIDQQIQEEERRVEAARVEKQEKEQARVAAIHHRIAEINAVSVDMIGKPAFEIAAKLAEVNRDPVSEWSEEFTAIALQAKDNAIRILHDMYRAAEAREAEAERERARQEEQKKKDLEEHNRLEVQRREQEAARQKLEDEERISRIRRENADREAKEKRDAEDKAAAEKRAEAQREQDERDAALRQERERQDEERRKIEADKMELMDGAAMLNRFVERFGKRREFAPVVRAIKDYMAKALAP
jgi:hypothetical protein